MVVSVKKLIGWASRTEARRAVEAALPEEATAKHNDKALGTQFTTVKRNTFRASGAGTWRIASRSFMWLAQTCWPLRKGPQGTALASGGGQWCLPVFRAPTSPWRAATRRATPPVVLLAHLGSLT